MNYNDLNQSLLSSKYSVKIDTAKMVATMQSLQVQKQELFQYLQAEVKTKMPEFEFNPSSSKDKKAVFPCFGVNVESFGKEVLEPYSDIEFVSKFLKYGSVSRIESFLEGGKSGEGFLNKVPADGIYVPEVSDSGGAFYFKSLSNMPLAYREGVLPQKSKFVYIDFSDTAELTVLAHVSNDIALLSDLRALFWNKLRLNLGNPDLEADGVKSAFYECLYSFGDVVADRFKPFDIYNYFIKAYPRAGSWISDLSSYVKKEQKIIALYEAPVLYLDGVLGLEPELAFRRYIQYSLANCIKHIVVELQKCGYTISVFSRDSILLDVDESFSSGKFYYELDSILTSAVKVPLRYRPGIGDNYAAAMKDSE